MAFPNSQRPMINLARSKFEGPFFVDMESFFEFSFWLSEELLDLEAKYRVARKLSPEDRLPSAQPRI